MSGNQEQQQQNDLDQLKNLLPGMSNSNVSKVSNQPHYNKLSILSMFTSFLQVEVMEAAAKYIEKLQNNLVGHIRTHGYPDKLKSYSNNCDDQASIRRAVDNYACRTMK